MPEVRTDEAGWPALHVDDKPIVVDMPDNPTPTELARVLGRVVSDHNQMAHRQWSAVVAALHWLHGAVMSSKASLDGLQLAHQRAYGKPPSVPPMRAEMGSVNEIIVEGKRDVDRELRQMASQTPGPKVVAAPEEITALFERTFAEKMQGLEERRALKAEQEALAAYRAAEAEAHAEEQRRSKKKIEDDERDRSDRTTRRRAWIAGVSASLFVAIVTWGSAYLWGKASGHDAGVTEGRQSLAPTAAAATVAPPPSKP